MNNNMNIAKHLNLLGFKATDRVSGFKGVITSVSHDLYGCIQGVLSPPVDKDGKTVDGRWFDISRLKLDDESIGPVMEQPNWEFGPIAEGQHGPAEKPLP